MASSHGMQAHPTAFPSFPCGQVERLSSYRTVLEGEKMASDRRLLDLQTDHNMLKDKHRVLQECASDTLRTITLYVPACKRNLCGPIAPPLIFRCGFSA
jgi:hypothetical protein